MRVVIAHDFMEAYGGAERTTAELARAFPDAPVAAITGRRAVAERMGVGDRFISLIPARERYLRHYRMLAPAYPAIVDRLRLPPADVVVSCSYGFSHRLRSENDAPRVSYSWGPLRFAWGMSDHYRARWARNPAAAAAFRAFVAGMRRADRNGAAGVDLFLAPLESVADDIRSSYLKEPRILKPPVDCDLFSPGTQPPGDYFLFCGRLVEPYKKVTMLVEAFNRLGSRLILAGDGPERQNLEAIAGRNIEFAGHLSDDELISLMRGCRAAIFPSRDDFGLVPVEVMACGRPVIAYGGGGALATVVPGKTGEFFERQTSADLEAAVASFDERRYDPATIRAHALQWQPAEFRAQMREIATELADAVR